MIKNSLAQFKSDCLVAANMVGDYMDYEAFPKDETLIANNYLKAVEENDVVGINGNTAMLILRHWKDIKKLFERCKTAGRGYLVEDFSSIVYERIMYAMKYQAWNREGSKTNAQACINMAIATEIKNQMYFSNLDKNKANVNTASLDTPVNGDSDDKETSLSDTLPDQNATKIFSGADSVVQLYVQNNQLVEAVIIDTIANGDTAKQTSEATTFSVMEKNNETGEFEVVEQKGKQNYQEFWRYKAAQALMNLPEGYEKMFAAKFSVAYEKICEAVSTLRGAKNQKIYKFLDTTIASMQSQKDVLFAILR